MGSLNITTLEYIYEQAFTEEEIKKQIIDIEDCIAYLLVEWIDAEEKTSTKIGDLLSNLYQYKIYLNEELEACYVPNDN